MSRLTVLVMMTALLGAIGLGPLPAQADPPTVPTVSTPTVPTVSTPTVSTPTVTKPKGKEKDPAPTVATPTTSTPTVTTPKVTAPTGTTPKVTTPKVTKPTVSTPTDTTPTVSTPTVSTPTATSPTLSTPTVTTPPAPYAPTTTVPAPTAGTTVGATAPTSTVVSPPATTAPGAPPPGVAAPSLPKPGTTTSSEAGPRVTVVTHDPAWRGEAHGVTPATTGPPASIGGATSPGALSLGAAPSPTAVQRVEPLPSHWPPGLSAALSPAQRRNARAQLLRRTVARLQGCMDDLTRIEQRILVLRTGMDGTPGSRRRVAHILGWSVRRVEHVETAGMRNLLGLYRQGICGDAAAASTTGTGTLPAPGGSLLATTGLSGGNGSQPATGSPQDPKSAAPLGTVRRLGDHHTTAALVALAALALLGVVTLREFRRR